DVEWQHFTNPVMQLVLDIKKNSTSGEPEAYRVRVLWFLNQGGQVDAMDVDQREVVFEDVDLLSFSPSTSQHSQSHNFSNHGFPLKAVYRDAVVGIRYMHPRVVSNDSAPGYRRFQVNFQKTSDASSFIDAIRHVCPCKANGPPAPAGLSARSVTMAPSSSAGSAPGSRMRPPEAPTSTCVSIVPAKRLHTSMTMAPPSSANATTNGSSTQATPMNMHIHRAPDVPAPAPSKTSRSVPAKRMRPSMDMVLDSQFQTQPVGARPYQLASSATFTSSRTRLDKPLAAATTSSPFPSVTHSHQPTNTSQDTSAITKTTPPSLPSLSGPGVVGRLDEPPLPLCVLQAQNQTHPTNTSGVGLPATSLYLPPAPITPIAASQCQSAYDGANASDAPGSALSTFHAQASGATAEAHQQSQLLLPSLQTSLSSASTATSLPTNLPSDLTSTTSIPLPTSLASAPTTSMTDDILTAIHSSSSGDSEPSLYTLSREELEMVVASVIREEGFADLMRTLDGMWRVKGLVSSLS
ncbi:hypothetical protein BC629DRAFT_1472855, partial [Irpex lacteus]